MIYFLLAFLALAINLFFYVTIFDEKPLKEHFSVGVINLEIVVYIAIFCLCVCLVYILILLIKRKLSSDYKTKTELYNHISKEDKGKHNIFIEVSDEFKFSVQNFLNSFNNYTRRAKGKFVNFQVYNAEAGLICMYHAKNKQEKRQIEEWFNEYVTFIYKQVDDININFEKDLNINEKENTEFLIKNTVMSFLEQCNLISQNSLKKEALFKMIGEKAGINIENIYIDGGSQQFGDSINNIK